MERSGFAAFRSGGEVVRGWTLVRHSKAAVGWRPQPHSKTLARGSGTPVMPVFQPVAGTKGAG
jgi:hypothetical protein